MGMRLARPVLQFTLDDEFMGEFPSIKEASKQFGGRNGTISNIWYAASGRSKTSMGYKWKFKESIK